MYYIQTECFTVRVVYNIFLKYNAKVKSITVFETSNDFKSYVGYKVVLIFSKPRQSAF